MRPTDLFVLVLSVTLIILLSPILLPLAAYGFIKNKIEEAKYRRYLATHERSMFFAYTDKASSKNFVEEEILPQLPSQTQVFHLAGKKGRYNMGEDFGLLAYVVGNMRETQGGFPYIAKVVRGELVTESINNKVYSAIRRGIGPEAIVERVLKFYET